jgi:hypothetical protein
MITQQEFVGDCYLEYAAQGLEPGNPEHGDWEQAHYPLPRALGDDWIWLLKSHHAIQGVLQSIELSRPCVFSWERKYLIGEWEWLVPHFEYWQAAKGKVCGEWTRKYCEDNPEIAKSWGKRAREAFKERYWSDPQFYAKHHQRKSEFFSRWNEENQELMHSIRQQNANKLHQYWHEHPEEYAASKKRSSEKMKRTWEINGHPNERKLSVKYPDGKIIEYRSINEAAQKSPISRSSIFRMLEGKKVKKYADFQVFYSGYTETDNN